MTLIYAHMRSDVLYIVNGAAHRVTDVLIIQTFGLIVKRIDDGMREKGVIKQRSFTAWRGGMVERRKDRAPLPYRRLFSAFFLGVHAANLHVQEELLERILQPPCRPFGKIARSPDTKEGMGGGELPNAKLDDGACPCQPGTKGAHADFIAGFAAPFFNCLHKR